MTKKSTTEPITAGKPVDVFVNSAGEEYQVRGLSPLLPSKLMEQVKQEIIKRHGSLPTVPTYTVTTASGETETHDHNSTTLVVEGDEEQTKENQKVWSEYLDKQSELNRDYNARIMKSVLLGVQAIPTAEWRDDMRMMGMDVHPEGSAEERYLFIETHVIQTPEDLSGLTTLVFKRAGIIPREGSAEVEATFRGYVERAFVEAGRAESQGQ